MQLTIERSSGTLDTSPNEEIQLRDIRSTTDEPANTETRRRLLLDERLQLLDMAELRALRGEEFPRAFDSSFDNSFDNGFDNIGY